MSSRSDDQQKPKNHNLRRQKTFQEYFHAITPEPLYIDDFPWELKLCAQLVKACKGRVTFGGREFKVDWTNPLLVRWHLINWMGNKPARAIPEYRNPTGYITHFTKGNEYDDDPAKEMKLLLGVVSNAIGSEQPNLARVSGFSLLPPGPQGILLALLAMTNTCGGSGTCSIQLNEDQQIICLKLPVPAGKKYKMTYRRLEIPKRWQVKVPNLFVKLTDIRNVINNSVAMKDDGNAHGSLFVDDDLCVAMQDILVYFQDPNPRDNKPSSKKPKWEYEIPEDGVDETKPGLFHWMPPYESIEPDTDWMTKSEMKKARKEKKKVRHERKKKRKQDSSSSEESSSSESGSESEGEEEAAQQIENTGIDRKIPLDNVTPAMAKAAYTYPKQFQARMFFQILNNHRGKVKFNTMQSKFSERTNAVKEHLGNKDRKRFQQACALSTKILDSHKG